MLDRELADMSRELTTEEIALHLTRHAVGTGWCQDCRALREPCSHARALRMAQRYLRLRRDVETFLASQRIGQSGAYERDFIRSGPAFDALVEGAADAREA